jgi:hypothetical protein
MTFRELTLREIKNQPLEATHIEIVDELNYAHGVKIVPYSGSRILSRRPPGAPRST